MPRPSFPEESPECENNEQPDRVRSQLLRIYHDRRPKLRPGRVLRFAGGDGGSPKRLYNSLRTSATSYSGSAISSCSTPSIRSTFAGFSRLSSETVLRIAGLIGIT